MITMSNDLSPAQPPAFPPERITATEQAGGGLVLLGMVGLASLIGWLTTRRRLWLAPLFTGAALTSGIFWIFRHPTRQPVSSRHVVLAPNDGLVRHVAMVREERYLHGPAMRVTIQVAMHNVQIMRSPLDGIVRARRYEPGTPARQNDDSLWLGIRGDTASIALQQVASRLWRRLPSHWMRRILCWADLEESLQAGQTIGHLTLGGTAEVYIPCSATIRVRAGQSVTGGKTVLATLPAD